MLMVTEALRIAAGPSTSVNRKMIVSAARFFKSGLFGSGGAASSQGRRSVVTAFPPQHSRAVLGPVAI